MPHSNFQKCFPHDLHHVDGFHREVALRLPRQGKVLDMGCGDNSAMDALRTAEREIWGTDFRAHPGLKNAPWFRRLQPDGTIPFASGYFDTVVSVMVLEHVDRPAPFFEEVNRVMCPGGFFIGHTISGAHYVTWIRRLLGLLPHSLNQQLARRLYGRACVDTFPAHYRLNRTGQIDRASQAAGFRRVGLRRYADQGYFRFLRPLEASARGADWVLEGLASGWGRLYFTVTLRKDCEQPRKDENPGAGPNKPMRSTPYP